MAYDGIVTSDVARIIKENFELPFIDSMDRDFSIFEFMPRKAGVGDGVYWKVHHEGNSSVASYEEDDEWWTGGKQDVFEASVDWALNAVLVEVSGLTQAITRSRQGSYMEALSWNVTEMLEDLKNHLNNQLIATSLAQSTDITGFPQIISSSGVYAGVNRSSVAQWRSLELANGSVNRPLTLGLIQQVMQAMFEPNRFNSEIDAILCAKKHYDQIGNILSAYRRYGAADASWEAGIPGLTYDGVKITPIKRLAPGGVYFLDTSDWAYYTLENFETVPIATNFDSDKFAIKHYSQLVCKHPGRQAKIVDLL